MAESLWTIADVARHFGVTIKTVRRWIVRGVIPQPAQLINGGPLYWKPSEITDFVDACRRETEAQCH